MNSRNFLKVSLLFVFILIIISFCSAANNDTIDYYLDENKVDEFNKLTIEQRNKILEGADEDKVKDFLEKLTRKIYIEKALKNSGSIAEYGNYINDVGKEKTNYPEELKFVGFGSDKLKFSGDPEKQVIGDGEVYINLNSLPKHINEVEYDDEKGQFILRGENGRELTLIKGSTDENGTLAFISKRDGKIGDRKISGDLGDFFPSGKVKVFPTGFRLEEENSAIRFGDLQVGVDKDTENGMVTFKDDGVILRGAYLFEKEKFYVNPNAKDKSFEVVFGDDWSKFKEKDYPTKISMVDADFENGRAGWDDRTYGKLDIKESNVYGGLEISNGEKNLKLNRIKTVDELKDYETYNSASPTMKKILEELVEDKSKQNIGFLQNRIFENKGMVKANPYLYEEYEKATSNYNKAPAGMAISSMDVDGKYNIFVNPKDVGGRLELYTKIDKFEAVKPDNTEGTFRINLDPQNKESSRSDLLITSSGIKKVGSFSTIKNANTIDEIRVMDDSGFYGKPYTVKYTGAQNPDGSQQLTLGTSTGSKYTGVTAWNAKLIPIQDKAVLNNGVVTYDNLGFPTQKYQQGLDTFIGGLEEREGDIASLTELSREAEKFIAMPEGPEKDARENQLQKMLDNVKSNPMLSDNLKKLIPEKVQLLTPERAEKITQTSGAILDGIRGAMLKDSINLRDKPYVAEMTLEMGSVEANKLPGGDANSYADHMNERGWVIDIGVRTPELETINFLEKEISPLVVHEASNVFNDARKEIIASQVTDMALQSILGKTQFTQEDYFEVAWWPDISLPAKEVGLSQVYIDEFKSMIKQGLSEVDLQGETHIRLVNPALGIENAYSEVLVSVTSNGRTIPLNIPEPEDRVIYLPDGSGRINEAATKEVRSWPSVTQFLKEATIASMRAPSKLRGEFRPIELPFLPDPLRVSNNPRLPNLLYEDHCRNRGYHSSPCNLGTASELKTFSNKPYLR